METQDNTLRTENTPVERKNPSTNTSPRPTQNQQFRNQRPNYNKRGKFYFRKKVAKVCKVCVRDFSGELDYKNVYFLKRFITEKGKILPRRISGLCAKHHRIVSRTIKQARTIALLSFTARG